mmetsp:Transcript_17969/g.27240  ORF Transcript_17969/g.27240 Transcript_17969/m.27240 type:complete len:433 (-) Transcript_17969:95-1393(-)
MMKYPLNTLRMARVRGLLNSIANSTRFFPTESIVSASSSSSSLSSSLSTYRPPSITCTATDISTASFSTSSSSSPGRGLRRKRQTTGSRFADAKTGIGKRLSSREQNEAAAARLSEQAQEMVVNNQDNPTGSGGEGGFVARDKDGNEVTMDEYLKFASLSPWVPCPDPVARRVFDIARTGPEDVHYELGSGDGRFNFQATDVYNVKKSVGIDIDPSLIAQSNNRIAKRHPRPAHIEFHCADLLESSGDEDELWNTMREECTIVTMYFVSDALQKLKPKFEQYLVGKKGCKIITVGYEMKGWESQWVEVCLGLTVHMYDMENLDSLYNSSFVGGVDDAVDNDDFLEDVEMDKELNILSRQKLAKMQEEEDAKDGPRNPFGVDTSVPKNVVLEEEVFEDGHWDFDENEVYGDDNDGEAISSANTNGKGKGKEAK